MPVPELRPEIRALVTQLISDGRPRSEAWRVFVTTPPGTVEVEELASLAVTGLWQAATRWEEYCARHGYDPASVEYFGAYATRRMRGAILDALRTLDWMTRADRARAKQLAEAGHEQGATTDELAASTGMSPEQVRRTLAAQSRRTVSLDAETAQRETVVDPQDVESDVTVAAVLAAVARCYASLRPAQQAAVAYISHQGMTVRQAARVLGTTEEQAARDWQAGVTALHGAMLRSVSSG